MKRSDVLNERPAVCDQPGCRVQPTEVVETEGGRRWYFCTVHSGPRIDPRANPDAAYVAFMGMSQSEWLGLIASLVRGGCLTVPEQYAFERAVVDRATSFQRAVLDEL